MGLTYDVNAPLLVFLAEYIGEDDAHCIDFFRHGKACIEALAQTVQHKLAFARCTALRRERN